MEIVFIHREPKNLRKSLRMHIVNTVRRDYYRRSPATFSYTELFKLADKTAKNLLDKKIYPSERAIFKEFMEVYHAGQKNMG